MYRVEVNRDFIILRGFQDIVQIDIRFGDQSIWSLSLKEYVEMYSGDLPIEEIASEDMSYVKIEWPRQMKRFLIGHTHFSIYDLSSKKTLFEEEIRFDKKKVETRVEGKAGYKLSWSNKHNRLDTVLSNKAYVKPLLLEATDKLLKELTESGYKVAVCSGTLMSAVRNKGKLMETEDDVDLLCYFEKNGDKDLTAAELNILQLGLIHRLEELGYTVFRHSGAHLQVRFYNEETSILEYFIDIFSAFEKEGYYCQPFAMRTKLDVNDIYPFGTIELEGYNFLAPGKPEVWLAGCYGDDWMIPNPSFKFIVPQETTVKFHSWFGFSNAAKNHYWFIYHLLKNIAVADLDKKATNLQLNTIRKYIRDDDVILDFGCGDGKFTSLLEQLDSKDKLRTVYAYDFEKIAVKETREQLKNPDSRVEMLNFHDRYKMFKKAIELKKEDKNYIINISFGFHQFVERARKRLLILLNRVLNENDYVVMSFDSELDLKIFDPSDPLTWHYDKEFITKEILEYGFKIVYAETSSRMSECGVQRKYNCVVLMKDKDIADVKKDEYLFL